MNNQPTREQQLEQRAVIAESKAFRKINALEEQLENAQGLVNQIAQQLEANSAEEIVNRIEELLSLESEKSAKKPTKASSKK